MKLATTQHVLTKWMHHSDGEKEWWRAEPIPLLAQASTSVCAPPTPLSTEVYILFSIEKVGVVRHCRSLLHTLDRDPRKVDSLPLGSMLSSLEIKRRTKLIGTRR